MVITSISDNRIKAHNSRVMDSEKPKNNPSQIDSSPKIKIMDSYADAKERFSNLEKEKNKDYLKANFKDNLFFLAEAYSQAQKHKNYDLAKKIRFFAIKYIILAQKNKLNLGEVRASAARIGIKIPYDFGVPSKVLHIFQLGIQHPKSATKKIFNNISKNEHDPIYEDPDIRISSSFSKIAGGLKKHNIYLHKNNSNTKIGEMIPIPLDAHVSAGYTNKQADQKAAIYQKYILFSSAAYSIRDLNGLFANPKLPNCPAALSITNGKPDNLFVSSSLHGIVIIKDGRPLILDAREIDVINIIEDALNSKGTVFQSNLIIHEAKNIVPKEDSSLRKDVRRVLVTFTDGSYGIIQINKHIDLYELGEILAKIPNIKEAVNLDTGGGNMGGYQNNNGKFHLWGYDGIYPPNIFFVKENLA